MHRAGSEATKDLIYRHLFSTTSVKNVMVQRDNPALVSIDGAKIVQTLQKEH